MTLNNDKEIQQKLFNHYMQDLYNKYSQNLNERANRINEEKEFNNLIDKQLQSEKDELIQRRKNVIAMQFTDHINSIEQNRIRRLRENREKMIPENVSLDLNSEKHLNSFKDYISKLSDSVDQNMLQYSNYKNKTPFKSPIQLKPGMPNDVIGIRRDPTDVTNASLFDKIENEDYNEYKQKNKEVFHYNIQLSKAKEKSKQRLYEINQLQDGDLGYQHKMYNQFDYNLKSFENEKKERYKHFLDEQRLYRIREKLANERYTIESANRNPFYYNIKKNTLVDQAYLNQNSYVEVNPCKTIILIRLMISQLQKI